MEIKKEIKLFRGNETNFNHNEWVLTECTTAKVTEDLESIFDLDLEYPLFDEKGLSQYLVKGNIIQCPISQTDTRGNQLFKIRKRIKNTKTKKVTVYAQAIARADLMKNWIAGCRVLAGNTRKQAISQILASCVEQQGYYVGNLDTNTNTSINLGLEEDTGNVINYLDVDVKNPLAGLIDDEKSVKLAYGGEVIFNNKEINMVDERGSDHSFTILSGKNLEELEEEIDDLDSENFATALTMRSSDGIYLPNQEIIYSPNAASLGKYFKLIVCDDVTAVDDTQESIDVVYAQLRERAAKAFSDGIDKLKINNTINFIQLANTEEYKDYAELEKCEIGNNVTVKYEKANVEATGRVVKIIFDALRMKIEEVEVGERIKSTFVETVTNTVNKVTVVNTKTNINKVEIKKTKKTTSDLRTEFDVADGKISAVVQQGDMIGSWVLKADSVETAFKKTDSNSTFTQTAEKVGAIVQQGDTTGTWELRADSVETAFKDTDSNTRLTQTTEQLEAVVQEGSSTGSWVLRADSVMQAINDDSGVHSTTLNNDGLSVKNGAFTIYDDSGNVIFRINQNGAVGIKDIDMRNSNLDKFSAFYQTIANMENLKFRNISCRSIYIDGKSLDQYILDVMA